MTGLLLIPGSFDPLHYGHLGIADEAAKLAGRSATFLVTRADWNREQFGDRLVMTELGNPSLPNLVDAYRGSYFVVGANYLDRTIDINLVVHLIHLGTVVYVAPRIARAGGVRTLGDVLEKHRITASPLPFVPLTRAYDISSAELRHARAQIARVPPGTHRR